MIQDLAWALVVMVMAFVVVPLTLYVWGWAVSMGWHLGMRHQTKQALGEMAKHIEEAERFRPPTQPEEEN